MSGNILSFSLREDGGIGALCDDRQHTGHGTDAVRQEQQHTHSATVEPCGRYAAVADLGQDRVFSMILMLKGGLGFVEIPSLFQTERVQDTSPFHRIAHMLIWLRRWKSCPALYLQKYGMGACTDFADPSGRF